MYTENIIKTLPGKWYKIIHFTSFTLNHFQVGLNIYWTTQRILTMAISIATYQLFFIKRQYYTPFHTPDWNLQKIVGCTQLYVQNWSYKQLTSKCNEIMNIERLTCISTATVLHVSRLTHKIQWNRNQLHQTIIMSTVTLVSSDL
jgi:hypothetical protein